jgi:general secretion pathway protein N
MKRALLWSAAAIMSMVVTVLISFPAAWLVPLMERKTGQHFTLADVQGTLWSGSGYLAIVNHSDIPVASPTSATSVSFILPGRFEWTLSPWVLLGEVDARITNSQLLDHPLMVSGSWYHWQFGDFNLRLPASQLVLLGSPLNTLRPSGQMRLVAQSLMLISTPEGLEIHGAMQLNLTEIASALSPVKPLGNYRVEFEWQGKRAQLTLATLSGALQLKGSGALDNGHVHFSGLAWALPEHEPRLTNLLNLLGRRHQVENRNVFVIELI